VAAPALPRGVPHFILHASWGSVKNSELSEFLEKKKI
jgi:hypothetical protein